MRGGKYLRAVGVILGMWGGVGEAGPYSGGSNDGGNGYDAGVPGFVGPAGVGGAVLDDGFGAVMNAGNYVNPIFFGWAESVVSYAPSSGVSGGWSNASLVLGPVTGDLFDVASLGDLSGSQMVAGAVAGRMTVHFAEPIREVSGADFSVFENGFLQGSVAGMMFGELAYVEVSADGVNFVRFPSRSLTSGVVGSYGTMDPTNVYNLAGKHLNALGSSWGTPFDLSEVGLASVSYVRLVDIPGNGGFFDSVGHSIYDPWLTVGSGGADVEAIGVIGQWMDFERWEDLKGLVGGDRGVNGDRDGDGVGNLLEYASGRMPDRVEAGGVVELAVNAGRLELGFTRDERARDLVYEVEARDSLGSGSWVTIARSSGGGVCGGVNGYAPGVVETRAGEVASVGVLRKVRVRDVVEMSGKSSRFLRLKVTVVAP